MQQGDGGGLRYAMQATQVLRERRRKSATPEPKTFSALFDMASSRARIRQRIRPTTTTS
jgi:hypothetical protein